MRAEEALAEVRSLFLDTAPVIYLLERNPHFGPAVESLFRVSEERGLRLVTSPVTLAECLVHPLRLGRADLVEAYRRLLTEGLNTELWPIGEPEAASAARLRAEHNLTLTDALQAAVCLASGCDVLLTNDPGLARVPALRPLLASALAP
jgi:predicted nucleic acid-binding protein